MMQIRIWHHRVNMHIYKHRCPKNKSWIWQSSYCMRRKINPQLLSVLSEIDEINNHTFSHFKEIAHCNKNLKFRKGTWFSIFYIHFISWPNKFANIFLKNPIMAMTAIIIIIRRGFKKCRVLLPSMLLAYFATKNTRIESDFIFFVSYWCLVIFCKRKN